MSVLRALRRSSARRECSRRLRLIVDRARSAGAPRHLVPATRASTTIPYKPLQTGCISPCSATRRSPANQALARGSQNLLKIASSSPSNRSVSRSSRAVSGGFERPRTRLNRQGGSTGGSMGDPTIVGSDRAEIHMTAFMPKQSRAVTAPCSRCSSITGARAWSRCTPACRVRRVRTQRRPAAPFASAARGDDVAVDVEPDHSAGRVDVVHHTRITHLRAGSDDPLRAR